jgi:hypothetical protein
VLFVVVFATNSRVGLLVSGFWKGLLWVAFLVWGFTLLAGCDFGLGGCSFPDVGFGRLTLSHLICISY